MRFIARNTARYGIADRSNRRQNSAPANVVSLGDPDSAAVTTTRTMFAFDRARSTPPAVMKRESRVATGLAVFSAIEWGYRFGFLPCEPFAPLEDFGIESSETIRIGSTTDQDPTSSSETTTMRRGLSATKSRWGTGSDRPSAKRITNGSNGLRCRASRIPAMSIKMAFYAKPAGGGVADCGISKESGGDRI